MEYWSEVQRLLMQMGVESLVFNYSGYGESSGMVGLRRCEEDAIAAYDELVRRGVGPIYLLGYSLGSAVVSAVAGRVNASGVILCEGFTTLCEAVKAAGLSRPFVRLAKGVWRSEDRLREINVPALIVHSDADALFPVSMAERLAEACGSRGRLTVVPGLEHNAPIYMPTVEYWGPIVEWIREMSESCEEQLA